MKAVKMIPSWVMLVKLLSLAEPLLPNLSSRGHGVHSLPGIILRLKNYNNMPLTHSDPATPTHLPFPGDLSNLLGFRNTLLLPQCSSFLLPLGPAMS